MSEFEIREIDGKYYLYCADEDIDVEWAFDTLVLLNDPNDEVALLTLPFL